MFSKIQKLLFPLSLFVLALSGPQLTSAGPLSDPLVVNVYKPGNQILIDQASATNGDQIILWSDQGRGNASFVQIYDVNGVRRFADDRYVGTGATAVGIDRVGNFVVMTSQPDGSDVGVFATRYDANGNVRGNTFLVNRTTVGSQVGPKIAMLPDGGFFVAWMSYSSSGGVVFARRFSAAGAALTSEIQVTPLRSNQSLMSAATDLAGNVIISGWRVESNNPDVWMRRFNVNGVSLGGELIVNTYTLGSQTGGSVATDSQGKAIVVWQSYGQDGNGWSLYGQRFDTFGTRTGTPFRIVTDLIDYEPDAKVAMTSDGSFVVTWLADNRARFPASKPSVRARQFRADGTPIAADFLVSTNGDAHGWFPLVTIDRAGRFLVGWRNYMASANYDVLVRRYVLDNLPAITTLINGQTASNLSGATGSWIYFKVNVPVGTRTMYVSMTGPVGSNADMYLNFGALPTLTSWEIRPYLTGSNEAVQIDNPPAGDWYIGVNGRSAFSGVSLTVRRN